MRGRLKVILAMLVLVGSVVSVAESNPQDPWESYNRSAYHFNRKVDKFVLKPITKAYIWVTPILVQSGVGHFFDNLREIPNFINSVLQAEGEKAAVSATRFVMNSTFGFLGLADPATDMGLEKQKQDFGQTLAHWGYRESRYVVIPLFGPNTVRDALGLAGDYFGSVYPYIKDRPLKVGLFALDVIDRRSRLLDSEKAFTAAAVDEYILARDAYLQRRHYLIEGGGDPSAALAPEEGLDNYPTQS